MPALQQRTGPGQAAHNRGFPILWRLIVSCCAFLKMYSFCVGVPVCVVLQMEDSCGVWHFWIATALPLSPAVPSMAKFSVVCMNVDKAGVHALENAPPIVNNVTSQSHTISTQ